MTKKLERAQVGTDRIHVTREFAACVRKMGAIVLDDSVAPNKPKNADFWLPAYNLESASNGIQPASADRCAYLQDDARWNRDTR
jgi:hypothetical protein